MARRITRAKKDHLKLALQRKGVQEEIDLELTRRIVERGMHPGKKIPIEPIQEDLSMTNRDASNPYRDAYNKTMLSLGFRGRR